MYMLKQFDVNKKPKKNQKKKKKKKKEEYIHIYIKKTSINM